MKKHISNNLIAFLLLSLSLKIFGFSPTDKNHVADWLEHSATPYKQSQEAIGDWMQYAYNIARTTRQTTFESSGIHKNYNYTTKIKFQGVWPDIYYEGVVNTSGKWPTYSYNSSLFYHGNWPYFYYDGIINTSGIWPDYSYNSTLYFNGNYQKLAYIGQTNTSGKWPNFQYNSRFSFNGKSGEQFGYSINVNSSYYQQKYTYNYVGQWPEY